MRDITAKAAQTFPQSGGLARVSHLGVLALMLGTVALPVSGAWAQQVLSGAQTTTQSPTVATGSPLVVTTALGFGVNNASPTTPGGMGIDLYSRGGISFTDTHQATITGFHRGIRARNIDAAGLGGDGGTALTITTTGHVTGKDIPPGGNYYYGVDGGGIFAENQYGGDLTISVASVTGDNKGIDARAISNTGALTITATGVVTGINRSGIDAYNQGTDLTISANSVLGGIEALSKGTRALSITATGDVTVGIFAQNRYGTSLTINAAEVSGLVYAKNDGTGALSITASGDVTAQAGDAILARNEGTALTISAASVSGSGMGINAVNNGSGALHITATGAVTTAYASGIFADGKGTDLTISATSVSGYSVGISAQNKGSGALSITATGAVTGGTTYDGILANNSSTGTDLTIAVASVSGGYYGINAVNNGSGALEITATGAVTGTNYDGIHASGEGTDLTISAASVTGGDNGIRAYNDGSGALEITATGPVTGTDGDGIYAYGKGTSLTISAADVSGGAHGIVAKNKGTGPSSITVSGDVSATDALGYGIASVSDLGDAVTINLLSTASVNARFAIIDTDGDAVVTISNGAEVTGTITLQDGNDTLTIGSGATLSGVTGMFGGNGTDTLNISSGWSGALDSWEVITADTSGGDFALDGFSLGGRSLGKTGDGTLTLDGVMTLASGSTLSMGVPQSAAAPLILATGAATIAGNLVVTPGQTLTFGQDYTLIEASALTGTFDNVSIAGGYSTTLTYTATSVLLRFDPDSLLALGGNTLSPNAYAVAAAFDEAVAGGFNPQAFVDLYAHANNFDAAVSQFSGELHSAERRVALEDTQVVRDAAFDRLGFGLTGGDDAALGGGGTLWTQSLGSWATVDADGTGAKATSSQGGVLMGADVVQGDVKYGGMFSYTNTDVDLGSLGSSKLTSTGAALYAGYRQDGSGLAFGIGGALASTSAKGERSISLTGLEQTLTSTVQGTSYQIFGEVSNDLAKAGNVQIEPFARFAYATVQSDAFAETGGIAALSGAKQSNDLRTAAFGLRGAYVAGDMTLSGSAAWLRNAGDLSAPTTLSMAGVNTPYEVNSAALAQDAVVLEAQASVDLARDMTLAGGYSGTIGKNNASHGVRVTLSVAW
jgi:outer membrane autotransporter protein